MSYNIGSIAMIGGPLKIKAGDVVALIDAHGCKLPAGCFLDEIEEDARGLPADEILEINRFWWHGERSGTSEDLLIKTVAPKLLGSADLILTWEDGDSHSGLRIKDGKCIKHVVVMTLGKECDSQGLAG